MNFSSLKLKKNNSLDKTFNHYTCCWRNNSHQYSVMNFKDLSERSYLTSSPTFLPKKVTLKRTPIEQWFGNSNFCRLRSERLNCSLDRRVSCVRDFSQNSSAAAWRTQMLPRRGLCASLKASPSDSAFEFLSLFSWNKRTRRFVEPISGWRCWQPSLNLGIQHCCSADSGKILLGWDRSPFGTKIPFAERTSSNIFLLNCCSSILIS